MGHRGIQEAPLRRRKGGAAKAGRRSAIFFVPSTACLQTDPLSDVSGPALLWVAARGWPVRNELARFARMP